MRRRFVVIDCFNLIIQSNKLPFVLSSLSSNCPIRLELDRVKLRSYICMYKQVMSLSTHSTILLFLFVIVASNCRSGRKK